MTALGCFVKEINNNLDGIIKSTLKIAEKNIETVMPGFTHLKNAQAVSFAHYLMAYIEMFNRDKKRFINNLDKYVVAKVDTKNNDNMKDGVS